MICVYWKATAKGYSLYFMISFMLPAPSTGRWGCSGWSLIGTRQPTETEKKYFCKDSEGLRQSCLREVVHW